MPYQISAPIWIAQLCHKPQIGERRGRVRRYSGLDRRHAIGARIAAGPSSNETIAAVFVRDFSERRLSEQPWHVIRLFSAYIITKVSDV